MAQCLRCMWYDVEGFCTVSCRSSTPAPAQAHHGCPGEDGAYSLEAVADAVAAYLEAEGLTPRAGGRGGPRLALVGYSLGARLALVLAARHGALFDSVRPTRGIGMCQSRGMQCVALVLCCDVLTMALHPCDASAFEQWLGVECLPLSRADGITALEGHQSPLEAPMCFQTHALGTLALHVQLCLAQAST